MSSQRLDDQSSALPPDDDTLAGEYVLGVLDGESRRHVEARMRDEVLFMQRVEGWQQHLAPMLSRYETTTPSPHVWPRIRSELGWPAVQRTNAGIWNNTGFWRATTGLALAAGIGAVVFGLRPPTTTPMPSPPVAVERGTVGEAAAKPVVVLTRDNGSTGWLATVDPSRKHILMVPVPTPLDASGRVDELWIIPKGGAPQSLGFVSNEKAHTVEVPVASQRALAAGATLAITLEPKAGMPHVAPTGPIVAKGEIVVI